MAGLSLFRARVDWITWSRAATWVCEGLTPAVVEKLRADFSEADTDAKRKQIASAIQARAVEVVPYVPIAVQFQVRAYRANLSGQVNPPAPVYWAIERR